MLFTVILANAEVARRLVVPGTLSGCTPPWTLRVNFTLNRTDILGQMGVSQALERLCTINSAGTVVVKCPRTISIPPILVFTAGYGRSNNHVHERPNKPIHQVRSQNQTLRTMNCMSGLIE